MGAHSLQFSARFNSGATPSVVGSIWLYNSGIALPTPVHLYNYSIISSGAQPRAATKNTYMALGKVGSLALCCYSGGSFLIRALWNAREAMPVKPGTVEKRHAFLSGDELCSPRMLDFDLIQYITLCSISWTIFCRHMQYITPSYDRLWIFKSSIFSRKSQSFMVIVFSCRWSTS